MRKLNYFLFAIATITLLFTSCAASNSKSLKNTKGGGWYHNRNVNDMDRNESAPFVFQPSGESEISL